MATLYRYFKDLWKLAVVALVLAAINQIFSLLDPLIFRHIIDSYATRYREYSSPQFIRGVGLLLAAAVGVALPHPERDRATMVMMKKLHRDLAELIMVVSLWSRSLWSRLVSV